MAASGSQQQPMAKRWPSDNQRGPVTANEATIGSQEAALRRTDHGQEVGRQPGGAYRLWPRGAGGQVAAT